MKSINETYNITKHFVWNWNGWLFCSVWWCHHISFWSHLLSPRHQKILTKLKSNPLLCRCNLCLEKVLKICRYAMLFWLFFENRTWTFNLHKIKDSNFEVCNDFINANFYPMNWIVIMNFGWNHFLPSKRNFLARVERIEKGSRFFLPFLRMRLEI